MSPILCKRLLTIGLDCLEPSLAFDRWADVMPNLTALRARGTWGRWKSIMPPITVPAWQCMVTGHDPGMLGIYGFRNRTSAAYDALETVDGNAVASRRIWDHLSRSGLKSIVLGVPLTYPPKPLAGVMVSGFPLPGTECNYTYPAALKAELAGVTDYIPDVSEFRSSEKAAIISRVVDMTRRRFRAAEHLLRSKPWQFFMMVEMGTDRLAHLLYSHVDPEHPRHDPHHPFAGVLKDYYALCDRLLGELILPYVDEPNTSVMVVSDHGARSLHGTVLVNEWLIRRGLLALKGRPTKPQSIQKLHEEGLIDWPNTVCWAEGGYYARLMLNIKGRERQGKITLAEREEWRERLTRELCALPGPDGKPFATKVFCPETAYREVHGLPPDLMVFFDDLGRRAGGLIFPTAPESLHLTENDGGPDDANHNWQGCFAGAGEHFPALGEQHDLSLLDYTPTVLDYFGLPSADDLPGRSLYARRAASARAA